MSDDVHPEVLSARACRVGSRVRKRLAGVERELAQADDLVQHLTARRAALDAAAEPEPAAQRQKTQASTDDSPTRPSPRARAVGDADRRRGRAMLGMLIGTLQQAERERAASEQGAVQQMALQRVDSRLRAEASETRSRQVSSVTSRLESERRRRDALQSERDALDARQRQLSRLAHDASLALGLRTRSSPAISWLPRVHSETTREMLDEQQRQQLPALWDELIRLEADSSEADAEQPAASAGRQS